MSCHYSVLEPGCVPHAPHSHEEEELLVVLAGEAVAVAQSDSDESGLSRVRLSAGQFMYYPSWHMHTIENEGEGPVMYVMFKWTSASRIHRMKRWWRVWVRRTPIMKHIRGVGDHMVRQRGVTPFSATVLFEGSSHWLHRLHGHVSHLQPSGGYPLHEDLHDVALILVQGSFWVNNTHFQAPAVLYMEAGVGHDMSNLSDSPARYLAFEFEN
jgi:mannose-6-phosphate isomerase-like protein (cupin superfamily)